MADQNHFAKIPEPALRRLPWYLSYVKLLKSQGETIVSSTQIARKIDVSASQIAKDLSYVDIQGKTRVGYDSPGHTGLWCLEWEALERPCFPIPDCSSSG